MWGKWPAAMLAIYTGTGVTPEVNLKEHRSIYQRVDQSSTLDLKPREDITRSPKQWYQ